MRYYQFPINSSIFQKYKEFANKATNETESIYTIIRPLGATGLYRNDSEVLGVVFPKDVAVDESKWDLIREDDIIKLELDSIENEEYCDPHKLYEYVMSNIVDSDMYYVLLDEIQKVKDFESVLNSFLRKKNLDVYVTGSNSKFLSSDIITEFRGRGDEIKVYPLSFSEFSSYFKKDKKLAWKEYIAYGGLPLVLLQEDVGSKVDYLKT